MTEWGEGCRDKELDLILIGCDMHNAATLSMTLISMMTFSKASFSKATFRITSYSKMTPSITA